MAVPNRSLFIRQIPYHTSVEDLRLAFSKFGLVKDVYIPRHYYSRKVRGFAYVEFERLRDAEYAVKHLVYVHGKELQVEFAQGDRKTPSEMRYRQIRKRSNERSHYRRHSRGHQNINLNRYRNRSRSKDESHSSTSRSRSRSPSYLNYKPSHDNYYEYEYECDRSY